MTIDGLWTFHAFLLQSAEEDTHDAEIYLDCADRIASCIAQLRSLEYQISNLRNELARERAIGASY